MDKQQFKSTRAVLVALGKLVDALQAQAGRKGPGFEPVREALVNLLEFAAVRPGLEKLPEELAALDPDGRATLAETTLERLFWNGGAEAFNALCDMASQAIGQFRAMVGLRKAVGTPHSQPRTANVESAPSGNPTMTKLQKLDDDLDEKEHGHDSDEAEMKRSKARAAA